MGSAFSRIGNCCFCCSGMKDEEPSFSHVLTGEEPVKQYSWDTRQKVDPSLYTIASLTSGEERIKTRGEVNGNQIIIRDCASCRIYILDHASQVTIDDCVDSIIVLGPVGGSVFLRDTKNSTLVCAAAQVRLRDCENIHLFTGAESDPIIEASKGVIVGPYMLNYKGIGEHFISAGLSRFRAHRWAEVYDFTPPQSNDSIPHWERFDRGKTRPEMLVPPPTQNDSLGMGFSFNPRTAFVPLTAPDLAEKSGTGTRSIKEMTFSLEPGQDQGNSSGLSLIERFYKEKFLDQEQLILLDVKWTKNQISFVYMPKR